MKTTENLCLPLTTKDVLIDIDTPIILNWGGGRRGIAIWQGGTIHLYTPDVEHQEIKVTQGTAGYYYVCPDCKELRKRLWLPLYGRHFACKICWNIGDDEPLIKPRPDEGQWAKLLKKFLSVMK